MKWTIREKMEDEIEREEGKGRRIRHRKGKLCRDPEINICENCLLIGQKEYSIIYWTNHRGCKKKSHVQIFDTTLSKPYHYWLIKPTFHDINQSKMSLENLLCSVDSWHDILFNSIVTDKNWKIWLILKVSEEIQE